MRNSPTNLDCWSVNNNADWPLLTKSLIDHELMDENLINNCYNVQDFNETVNN